MTAIILIFFMVGVIYYLTAPVPISVQIAVEAPAPTGGAWYVPNGTVLYDRSFGALFVMSNDFAQAVREYPNSFREATPEEVELLAGETVMYSVFAEDYTYTPPAKVHRRIRVRP